MAGDRNRRVDRWLADHVVGVLIGVGGLAMATFFGYLVFVGDDMPSWMGIPLVVLMLIGAAAQFYVALREDNEP